MNKISLILLITLISFSSCFNKVKETFIEQWKSEILTTEKEFAEMAQKEGIAEAFSYYAAKDAVLMRNNKLIFGKDSIDASYKKMNLKM